MNFNEKTLEFWWIDISKRINFGENDQKNAKKAKNSKFLPPKFLPLIIWILKTLIYLQSRVVTLSCHRGSLIHKDFETTAYGEGWSSKLKSILIGQLFNICYNL